MSRLGSNSEALAGAGQALAGIGDEVFAVAGACCGVVGFAIILFVRLRFQPLAIIVFADKNLLPATPVFSSSER